MTDPTHRHPNVCNLGELDLAEESHGDRYTGAHAMIGRLIGSRQLGCRFTEIPPGDVAWPYHRHHANEELFVILAGTGTLRIGDDEVAVRPEDVIATPAGPNYAHQLVNTGDEPLRYLAVSTMHAPDVVEYPDSGHFAVFAGSPPGGQRGNRTFHHIGRLSDGVSYRSVIEAEDDH